MKAKEKIEFDGVDLLLLAAIAILAVVLTVLVLPLLGAWCPWLGTGWQAIWRVRQWPFWVWTAIGVGVLIALLWLRTRYE